MIDARQPQGISANERYIIKMHGDDSEPVSECCEEPIIGLDDGLGHCSGCNEWTTPKPEEEREGCS